MESVRLPEHPDAQAEYIRLQQTCDAIEREVREVEALTGAKAGECMDVRMEEDPDQQLATFLHEMTHIYNGDLEAKGNVQEIEARTHRKLLEALELLKQEEEE